MKFAIAALVLACPFLYVAANDMPWSNSDNGLKARLSVYPPEKPESPFYRIFIEFKNIDNVAGQKIIPFDPAKMSLKVTGKNNEPLKQVLGGAYDGITPNWEPTRLPFEGSIKFLISFPGLGFKRGTRIIDLGPSQCWIIPQDGSTYYLSGIVSVDAVPGSQDWSGKLIIPPTPIAQKNAAEQGAAANP